jgi:hypothetical protein
MVHWSLFDQLAEDQTGHYGVQTVARVADYHLRQESEGLCFGLAFDCQLSRKSGYQLLKTFDSVKCQFKGL